MSIAMAIALVLALAAVAASLRHAQRWRRLPAASRPARWRMAAILLLQFACAALLLATLLPPGRMIDAPSLAMMTAGTDGANAREVSQGDAILIALPEAGAEATIAAGARAMPDLATALRLYPQADRLLVLGTGLEARDREAARGLHITFEPPPLPSGLIELHAPARVASGGLLRVSGRVHGADERSRVELLDPAGTVQDRAIPDDDGYFQLQAPVRASGPAIHRLRLRADVETEAAIPVDAQPGDRVRLLLLAGAPSPELKYLRRWASDAGLELRSRMALGGGVAVADGALALDRGTLSDSDLLIVDERAWAGLGATTHSAVLAAVDQGLGLMLRITSKPDATTRNALRQLGFALGDADPALASGVVLDTAKPAELDDAPDEAPPALARQPHPIIAAGSVSLLEDASGASLARWRQSGRGRIAIWNLDQSFRLALTGHHQHHARLWSEATGTFARAGARRQPRFEGIARAGQRVVLCDFEPGTALIAGDGTRQHPLHDPATPGCAALWPERSGWHRMGEGEAAPMLYVHAADAFPGIAARARRDATLRMAATATPRPADAPPGTSSAHAHAVGSAFAPAGEDGAGPRWPWFLAWLLATGLLWWLERTTIHGTRNLPKAQRRRDG